MPPKRPSLLVRVLRRLARGPLAAQRKFDQLPSPAGEILEVLLIGGTVVCLVGLLLTTMGGRDDVPEPRREPLPALVAHAKAGDVKAAVFDEQTSVLTTTYKAPNVLTREETVTTVIPAAYQGAAVADLTAADVDVHLSDADDEDRSAAITDHRGGGAGSWLGLLAVVGLLLFGGPLLQRALGGNKLAGRGVDPAAVPETRFADVAGCDEALAQLTEAVEFLKHPEKFTRTGAKPPKGALLCGPPGTGKTLLARAVAGEAGVPFFSVSGTDFVEMYVGVGAKRVRQLFADARKHERAIVFIDEIDAVGRRRSSGDVSGGTSETENTLNALLTEMDGFTGSNIIVLGATNRPDILDEAITRPGRLDRKVEVPNPDRRGREAILAVHVAGKPVAADVDLTMLARRTPGFSGAQMAALVNEACLYAARHDLEQVTAACFAEAVATIAMGRARTSALVTDHDRQVTAWHEAGHTVAAYLQADADDPVSVSIIPRGPAGGVTWMSGNDDLFLPRRKAHAQLITALAGRAAEEALLGGEYTQGAHGDLTSATDLARKMVTQYGMTRLGYQVRTGSDASTQAVADVIEELLTAAHESATALLEQHRDLLEQVALTLLEEETLTLADIDAIAHRLGVARHAQVAVPPLPPRRRPVLAAATSTRPTAPARRRLTPVVAAATSAATAWRAARAAQAPSPQR